MSVYDDLFEIGRSLDHIEKTGMYDVEKYSCSLKHLTSQLEYFYCHLVPNGTGQSSSTFYHLHYRPKVHELAYFNIGRGFPKELMDGHWCYILKDLGYKMLVYFPSVLNLNRVENLLPIFLLQLLLFRMLLHHL